MIRLLVVDDEADICEFVRNFFKERDFEVFMAYNGKEALGLVETIDPHIVLLDLKMPVMDGMETLRAVCGDARKLQGDAGHREKLRAFKIVITNHGRDSVP